MSKSINILDKDYTQWVQDLSKRFRQSQIKAAVKVNSEMLRFYWELGRDIVERDSENKYGSGFFDSLSRDLRKAIPDSKSFSSTNLRYMQCFYVLYSNANLQQVVEDLPNLLFTIPWGHHIRIMDKCKDNVDKALFFVRKVIENSWSRKALLTFLDTDLYERQGKALTNFERTLPAETSDLAKELTKDPY